MSVDTFCSFLRSQLTAPVAYNSNSVPMYMPIVISPDNFVGDPSNFPRYDVDSFYSFGALLNLFKKIQQIFISTGLRSKHIEKEGVGYCLCVKNSNGDLPPVNINHDSVDRYAQKILEGVKGEEKLRLFLTGKVGVGKSTFLHYIFKKYSEQFAGVNLHIVKFDYPDYDFDVRHNDHDLSVAKQKTDRQTKIEIDILKKSIVTCLSDCCTPDFLTEIDSHCQDKVKKGKLDVSSEQQISGMVNSLKEYVENNKKPSVADVEDACSGLEIPSVSCLVRFFFKCGHKFLVVFDGLDRLSPDSWYCAKYKEYVEAVHSLVFAKDFLSSCSGVRFHYLLVLRNCSFQIFTERNRQADNKTIDRSVVSHARACDVIVNAISCVLMDKYDIYPLHVSDNLYALFDGVLRDAVLSMKLTGIDDLIRLFEYNYRKLFRFAFDVVLFVSYQRHNSLDGRYKETDLKKFAQFLALFELRSTKGKRYRVTELLLFSNRYIFSNYFHVDQTKSNFRVGNRDSERGYVDNIFNYTFSKTNSGVPFLLEKLRIIQFCDSYIDRKQIYEFIGSLGYKMSIKEFDFTLQLLVQSGFLKVRAASAMSSHYKRTAMGDYLINGFVCDYRYIVHAAIASYFPSYISKHMKRRFQHIELFEFVEQNIINVYVFISFLRFVEARERDLAKNSKNIKAFLDKNQIYNRVRQDFLGAVRRILSSPIDGRYIDLYQLKKKILAICESWLAIPQR